VVSGPTNKAASATIVVFVAAKAIAVATAVHGAVFKACAAIVVAVVVAAVTISTSTDLKTSASEPLALCVATRHNKPAGGIVVIVVEISMKPPPAVACIGNANHVPSVSLVNVARAATFVILATR
jgi:hypothetical protein